MRSKQEKRASVIPKSSGEPNSSSLAEAGKDSKEPENPFGAIKLRSTGRASNLTSPTSDFSPEAKQEAMDSPEEKPRPPPKPRPWSIVGVDRKSGEFTTLETDQLTPASPETITEVESEKTEGRRSSLANRGSVRDMIANLNKPEKEGGGTV